MNEIVKLFCSAQATCLTKIQQALSHMHSKSSILHDKVTFNAKKQKGHSIRCELNAMQKEQKVNL